MALAGREEREPDRVDATAAWDAEEVVARLAGIEAALCELTETVEALRRRLGAASDAEKGGAEEHVAVARRH